MVRIVTILRTRLREGVMADVRATFFSLAEVASIRPYMGSQ